MLSQEFDHLAHEAVREEIGTDSTSNLKMCYIRCFDQAEIDGIDESEIVKVVLVRLNALKAQVVREKNPGASDSECLINERWFYEVASGLNLTDPDRARNPKRCEVDEEPHQKNSSGGPHSQENEALIESLDSYMAHLKIMRNHLHNRPFTSLMAPGLVPDLTVRIQGWAQNCEDYFNNKQTIPTAAQVIFLRCFSVSSGINDAFSQFFDEVKRVHILNRGRTKKTNSILTTKEIRKITGRTITNLHKALEPIDDNDARLNGFYGQECQHCGSFRTREKPDSVRALLCSKCHKDTEKVPVKP